MPNELKSCPFCGNKASIIEAVDKKGKYHVVCNEKKHICAMVAGMPLWRNSKEEAAKDWNRRADNA